MSDRTPEPIQIYQIKVTLRKLQPPIWRRIRLRSDVTLAKLHRILQCAMGWEDAHLHQFVIRGEHYGIPDKDDLGPSKTRDERKYKLSDVMPGKGSQCAYLYDFGDNWEHILLVESTLAPQEGRRVLPPIAPGSAAAVVTALRLGISGSISAHCDPRPRGPLDSKPGRQPNHYARVAT